MKETDIIIVGGGPAGAYLSYSLSKESITHLIFDDSHPREKPCGGGISVLAIEKFPILHELPIGKSPGNEIILISPKNRIVKVKGIKESWAVSRLHLDKFILDRAVENGSKLIKERVIDVKLKNGKWVIKTNKGKLYKSEIIVGADGVNSVVRKKILGPIPAENLGFCYGYFAKSRKKEDTIIKFLNNRQGYIWCFPREDHLSIGIGTELLNSKGSKMLLDRFIKQYLPHIRIFSKWGALIPLVKNPSFFKLPCSGKNWALIGDAAGHVDPMTGEGITYALWSAELLAKAILENDVKSYDKLWRKEYGLNLLLACELRKFFYNKYALELSTLFASKSKTYGRVLYDLIVSDQDYRTFFFRILKDSMKITKELIFRF